MFIMGDFNVDFKQLRGENMSLHVWIFEAKHVTNSEFA